MKRTDRETVGRVAMASALVVAGYWLFSVATFFALYWAETGLTAAPAFLSAVADACSLLLVWLVALVVAHRLPLVGPAAFRNLLLTFAAALSVLSLRVAMLRVVMRPMGWFEGQSYAESVVAMLPRNMLTFSVLWVGGWAFVHYRRMGMHELRAATLRFQLIRARLTTLMARLQPHFVGNALHAISFLIDESPEAARKMLRGLRAVVEGAVQRSDDHEVPLQEELSFIEQWFEVQSQRFSDRMTFRIRSDEDALRAWVPRLVLQPLVENAVMHGVGNATTRVLVEVTCKRVGDRLVITVDDDGPGTSVAGGPPVREHMGIGLSNTRERLAVMYEGSAVLSAGPGATSGFSTRIDIPYRTSPTLKDPALQTGSWRPGLSMARGAVMPSVGPASASVTLVAVVVITALLTAEVLYNATTINAAAAAGAVMGALLRTASVLIPAAVAFLLPKYLPATRLRNVLAALCVVAATTSVAVLVRSMAVAALAGSAMPPLGSVVLHGVHTGTLLMNVLAAGYVARLLASSDEEASTVVDAEVRLLEARQQHMTGLLDMEEVISAFDRIERLIGVDSDAAIRQVAILDQRMRSSLASASGARD